MKKFSFISVMVMTLVVLSSTLHAQNFKKQTFKNDPINVIHYTLDNGLEVFMSVDKSQPRIQTYIAVRVGSKNDPQESTGLSHYLEHLMFKGTTHFGTLDWEKEKVYIQEIEKLYEVYNHTTDPQERAEIYHQIDSVSYLASQYAIPNEYDKLMSLIGAQNTNAFTSNDMTVYQEDIPSNELERWLMVEKDRFENPVFRLFHTELETVYEEKNMNMANDGRTLYEEMNLALFPHHPYGTQTTIGTVEHLKNPSLSNINKHFSTYYVPNNYCIALSGDFDPEEAIQLINKYFGTLKAKPVPEFTYQKESPITEVQEIEVIGLEAENVRIGYRIDAGDGSKEVMMAELIDAILSNGKCGLIDQNINQKQLAMRASSGVSSLNDYSSFLLSGQPKQGQSLEELRDLLLEQVEIFKQGEWDESLLPAAINNIKYREMTYLESYENRAMAMISAYLSHRSWQDVLDQTDNMAKITKQELIDFANQLFKDNNYVVAYKRQGERKETQKIEKPAITPVVINRDQESEFFSNIKQINTKPIEPAFVNYDKDMKKSKLSNGAEVLYVENKENKTFQLVFRYEYGTMYDKLAGMVNSFLSQLESENRSLAQIRRQMYDIACSYSISFGSEYSTISISGLSENMDKALEIVEDIIANPKLSQNSVDNSKMDIMRSRQNQKTNQNAILSRLQSYANYGKQGLRYQLSNEEIEAITSDDILNQLNIMTSQAQTVMYYGPMPIKSLTKKINSVHKLRMSKMMLQKDAKLDAKPTTENTVYFVHYNAKQSLCRILNTSDKIFDEDFNVLVNNYNGYFGGGMNAIVFQELREKRSLAYTAYSFFSTPSDRNLHYINISHIGTQNDKVIDALSAFYDLFEYMPQSEGSFNLAKQSIISDYRTDRVSKMGIINSYLNDKKFGYAPDHTRKAYESAQKLTLEDVIRFNQENIKNKKHTIIILGNENEIDFNALRQFGDVKKLSLEEIFGY